MSLVLQSSGGGSVTLQEPVTASNLTITVPAETGTMITTASTFAGTGPAFSAYQSITQSGITNVVPTKVQFQTEEFDTNSNFDNSTNYRFTPTVAGYYQVNGGVTLNSITATHSCLAIIYKNGSAFKNGCTAKPSTSNYPSTVASTLIYLNGSTDYVELYIYGDIGSAYALVAGQTFTYFSASMVRAA
jgi:hypothetical protein